MKGRILAGALCAATVVAPILAAADREERGTPEDMRRAIAFERHKEAAAARQARIEAGRDGNAERSADRSEEQQPRNGMRDKGERRRATKRSESQGSRQ